MSFGKRLQQARKDREFSQEDLAALLGTKGPAIGRYERDEMKPSIEVAARMAELLQVSLDFLVGHTDVQLDPTTRDRILAISAFTEEDRQHLFAVIDAFIAKEKMQRILQ